MIGQRYLTINEQEKAVHDYSAHLQDLEVSLSILDADTRAARFLLALSYVAQDLVSAEYKLIIAENIVDVTFADLMSQVTPDCKSADSRRAWIHRQPEYMESVEKYAKAKSQCDYLKRLYSLFENSHVYNRCKAKI